MEPSTSKFQQALPYAILPVSASLAAVQRRRTRREDTSIATSQEFCFKCGFYLLDGQSTSRSARNANGTRCRQTTCGGCNHISEVTLSKGAASSFPPSRHRRKQMNNSTPNPITLPEPQHVAPPVSLPPPPPVVTRPSVTPTVKEQKAPPPSNPTPPARTKKKSVLQDMLARNRKREEKTKEPPPSGGLAAFLGGL